MAMAPPLDRGSAGVTIDAGQRKNARLGLLHGTAATDDTGIGAVVRLRETHQATIGDGLGQALCPRLKNAGGIHLHAAIEVRIVAGQGQGALLHVDRQRAATRIADGAIERPDAVTGLGQRLEVADIARQRVAGSGGTRQGQRVGPAATIEAAGNNRIRFQRQVVVAPREGQAALHAGATAIDEGDIAAAAIADDIGIGRGAAADDAVVVHYVRCARRAILEPDGRGVLCGNEAVVDDAVARPHDVDRFGIGLRTGSDDLRTLRDIDRAVGTELDRVLARVPQARTGTGIVLHARTLVQRDRHVVTEADGAGVAHGELRVGRHRYGRARSRIGAVTDDRRIGIGGVGIACRGIAIGDTGGLSRLRIEHTESKQAHEQGRRKSAMRIARRRTEQHDFLLLDRRNSPCPCKGTDSDSLCCWGAGARARLKR